MDEFGANKKVRRLTTQHQFIALLYAQLAGSESLRAIEAGFESHASKLYHLGACEVSRSTLSDANAQRPCAVFTGLLAELMGRCERALGRRIAEAAYLIDATGFRLSSLSADWAQFGRRGQGTSSILDTGCPSFAELYRQCQRHYSRQGDADQAGGHLRVRSGITRWPVAKLDAAGCRIVTRLKVNTPLAVVADNPVPEHSLVLSDQIGRLPARQARSPQPVPGSDPRTARANRDRQMLRIVTNDLDAPADQIAELYKRRWQIELFFRSVKHSLKIRHFFGTSENAVRIQIAIALIAFLLLRMAHALQNAVQSLPSPGSSLPI